MHDGTNSFHHKTTCAVKAQTVIPSPNRDQPRGNSTLRFQKSNNDQFGLRRGDIYRLFAVTLSNQKTVFRG